MGVFKVTRCPCGSGNDVRYCHCKRLGKAGITHNGRRVPAPKVPRKKIR
jgi:hypothetical protein